MSNPEPNSPPGTGQLLALGVAQAVCFVLGGLAGYGLGKLLGFDAMDPAGYTPRAMVGIVLIGICSGASAQLARRWHARRYHKHTP